MARILLAGDVGGTKTLLALYSESIGGPALTLHRKTQYPSRAYSTLEDVCAEFLRDGTRVDAAAFGVPGVVIDGTAAPSNLDWRLDAKKISTALGGVPVRLLNDLAATAMGVINLAPADVEVIHQGRAGASVGNVAVIAAGTGLGEAALAYHEGHYYPVVSEGGHSSFAPEGEEQIELLRFLARKFGHVSCERVLSGRGLVNVYRFLRERSGVEEPQWLRAACETGDPAAAISVAASAGRDAVCVAALEMFCAIYGAEAANLSLKVLALGGVYLCGGIAPKILPALKAAQFSHAFTAKGRLSPVLEQITARVAINPETALLGAAHSALAVLC